ncbi:PLP-dependent transferase [Streptomyces sp. NPDC091215]|uniref:PLP-dependent transferase n=1 Tax=Streptomyces sp. NPDC091215 TaxID=3155192 RepID=UPI003429D3D5
MFRTLEHGAVLVVHSLTKSVNGHGDALGGAVIGPREPILPIKTEAMINVGAANSPFNAWLISRGSITLPVRLRQYLASAQRVAEFLDNDPRVPHVAYQELPSHPQHELARRQFRGQGFGALMAFALDAWHDTRNAFVGSLRLITSAVSLGHDETLIVHEDTHPDRAAMFPEVLRTHGLLRPAVGLEDPDALVADLAAALDTSVPAA